MNKERNVLDILLNANPLDLPKKDYKMKRLSQNIGEDVVFTIRAMAYDRIAEIRQLSHDGAIHIVLAGVVSPDLKSPTLLEKYKAATPAELLKNPLFLLPGEVEELSMQIERLSGFRINMLEEVKKN